MIEAVLNILVAVMAGVVSNRICKWLDGNQKDS